MAGWPAGQRSSPCGIHSWICDRGYIRGRQLEELRGPAEGLSDGAARQLIVVGLIPCPLPCPAAWWKRSERRLWHRPPRPACDRPVAGGRAGRAGVDELGKIGFVADPVPAKAQPCPGFPDWLALCRGLGCHPPVVGIWVMAHHRGVYDGPPPHRLTDHRERPRQIGCPYPGKPFCRGRHRGDRPLQRAGPGVEITGMLAVPFDPAAGRAEPSVLAARRERSAALLAVPYVCYHSCAPHWGVCAALPVSAVRRVRNAHRLSLGVCCLGLNKSTAPLPGRYPAAAGGVAAAAVSNAGHHQVWRWLGNWPMSRLSSHRQRLGRVPRVAAEGLVS